MSDGEPTIRPAVHGDVPTLGRMGAALLRTHHAFDPLRFMAPTPGIEGAYGWFLGTQLSEPDAVVLVAERTEGVVIGYVYAGLEPRSWHELREPAGFVHDVFVDEDARGSGIGAALLEAAIVWLKAHGAPRVLLWTAQQNQSAHRLFERLRFRRTMIEMTREL